MEKNKEGGDEKKEGKEKGEAKEREGKGRKDLESDGLNQRNLLFT